MVNNEICNLAKDHIFQFTLDMTTDDEQIELSTIG